jgi:hypothetical protein
MVLLELTSCNSVDIYHTISCAEPAAFIFRAENDQYK